MTERPMSAELQTAIADVMWEMGVDMAPANEIAERLPEHLRGEFWEAMVGRYLAQELAALDEKGSGS